MSLWPAILVASAGCYLFKLAGLSVPQSVLARPVVQRIAGLLPIVLLAALIAVQTFGDGKSVVLDARVPGIAVACFAAWRKWPFLLVIVLAAATTAVFRLIGPGS